MKKLGSDSKHGDENEVDVNALAMSVASVPSPDSSSSGTLDSAHHSRGQARQRKRRPEPLAFPDDPSPSHRQYGTFAGAVSAAEGPGGASSGGRGEGEADAKNDDDEATAEYRWRRCAHEKGQRGSTDMGLWEYLTSPHSPLVQIRDHCQHQWIAILFTIILLGLIIFFVFGASAPQRATGCNSDFGVYLGEHGGVAAYSNCRYEYNGDGLDHYVTVGLQRVYSGSKWHALEYARRYWTLTRLLTFPSLDTPDMLFNVTSAYLVTAASAATIHSRTAARSFKKGQQLPVEHFYNLPEPLLRGDGVRRADDAVGAVSALKTTAGDAADNSREGSDINVLAPTPLSSSAAAPAEAAAGPPSTNPNGVALRDFVLDRCTAMPREGDLLVYEKHLSSLRRGHVAVIVGVQGPFHTLEDVGHRVLDAPKSGAGGGVGRSSSHGPLSPDKLVMNATGQWHYSEKDIAEEKNGQSKVGSDAGKGDKPSGNSGRAARKKKGKNEEEEEEEASLQRGIAFAYRVRAEEADCVLYRVYLAEQNWNNRPWMDVVEGDRGEKRVRRRFSRAILLKEYYPSRTFYVEDNSGQRIIGWIRPPL